MLRSLLPFELALILIALVIIGVAVGLALRAFRG